MGLALFALGIIVFFGQGYALVFLRMILSPFISADSGGYEIISQSYLATYTLAIALIILGVVMFYKGRKEPNNSTSSSTVGQGGC
ncbi:MAG: hypothetical protein ACREAZ_10360 [Nitrososphaera sp.]